MELTDRCCIYFDPSKANVETNGAVSGELYPFDEHLQYDSCWSAERGASNAPGNQNWICCEYITDHTACPQYQPSDHQLLKFVRIPTGDGYHFVVVDKVRLSVVGFAEYRLYHWSNDEADNFDVAPDTGITLAANSLKTRGAEAEVMRAAAEMIAGFARRGGEVTKLPLTQPTDVTIEKRSFIASLRG